MFPLPRYEGDKIEKCQLAVLDALVHKSQHFKFINSFQVSFEGDDFKNCVLVSESECLVFTERNQGVILVDLIDQKQRVIRYPQGVNYLASDGHSLNVMMNGTPYIIIAAYYFDGQIESAIKNQYPNQCHNIGKNIGYRYDYLLTVMQYDAVEQKLNKQVDLTASALVIGDKIKSLLQYSHDSIMICGGG